MAEKIQVFEVSGLDCPDCARKVAEGVQKLPGVHLSELNFATGKLTVTGESEPKAIEVFVRAMGHDLQNVNEDSPKAAPRRSKGFFQFLWMRSETRLALLGTVLVVPGLILTEFLQQDLLWVNLLAIAAVFTAGFPVARSAWRNIRINRSIDINFLMSIAAIGALFIGAYTEAGMVIVLFALGEALEGFTAEKARRSIESLMDVVPDTATRLERKGDSWREI